MTEYRVKTQREWVRPQSMNGGLAVLTGYNNAAVQTIAVQTFTELTANAYDSTVCYDPGGLATNTYSFTVPAGLYSIASSINVGVVNVPATTLAAIRGRSWALVDGDDPQFDGTYAPIIGTGYLGFGPAPGTNSTSFEVVGSGLVKVGAGAVISLGVQMTWLITSVQGSGSFFVYVNHFSIKRW